MSTHAYYSSGENLDGEYVLPETAPVKTVEKLTYPPEFDFNFFTQKQQGYDKSCPDYWEWDCFKKYSKAAYRLYVSALNAFAAKFGVEKQAFNLPQCLVAESYVNDLDAARNDLREAETKLYMQFNKSNRSIKAKLSKNATLKKLRQYAAEALTLYYVLTEELYLKSAIKFKNYYQNYNFDSPLDILLCFRGCVLLERQTRLFVKPDLLTDKHHLHDKDLYDDVDFTIFYNQLCNITGAFNTNFYAQKLEELYPKVKQLKSDENYAKLIYFYEKFDFINLLIYHVDHIAKYYSNRGSVTYACFEVSNDVDCNVYEMAKDYLNYAIGIQDIAEALNPVFKKDIAKIIEKLTASLQNAAEIYKKSTEI